MKTLFFLIGLLILGTNVFSSTPQDSTSININAVDKIVKDLKEKLEPKKYYLGDTFIKTDISYSYPNKIIKGSNFDITIMWKGAIIFTYEVTSTTYKLTGAVADLR